YGIVALLYFLRFKLVILRTDFLLLLFAFVFFGLMLMFDLFVDESGLQFLLEDGFKFFGIVSWLTYFATTCKNKIEVAESV
ncbi:MAG: hypothetical protein ACLFO6_06260, partial [Archaeoglobaceae archaeon]